MSVFEHCEFDSHEHVAFFRDDASGLKAIIAVHNTNLGPALGGCRMWPYANSDEALTDVLRLSKGMTYKAAMANIALGGGKSVIIGNPRTEKSEALLEAMGRFINSFKGTYYTAEDSGIAVADVHTMARHSTFVSGTQAKYHFNGEVADGNPAPATAYGVFVGLKTAVKYALNSDLSGVKVAIQGMGNVGTRLGKHLKDAGAQLYVADIYSQNAEQAAEELGATLVSSRDILGLDVDVLAPCAMGAVINDDSLPLIKAKVIAGAANNQLATEVHGAICQQKGILYAPDYVINAGGIIDIYHQRMSSSHEQLRRHIESIEETLFEIFERAKETREANNIVANLIAQERFST